jgi:hypothetical protein
MGISRATYADGIDILAAISPDGQNMNWGRAQGKGFGNFRTNIMDVSSLDVGPENYTPFDTSWGEPMPAEEN